MQNPLKFYNMCLRKKSYKTLEIAQAVANQVLKTRGTKLRAYYCPFCNRYHLTSKENINEKSSRFN